MCKTPIGFLILLLIGITFNVIGAPSNYPYKDQRELYTKTQERIDSISHRKNLPADLIAQIESLKDYPLYPYLALSVIKRNIVKRPIQEIQTFLNKYKTLPITYSLRTFALNEKYYSKQWGDVIKLSNADDKTIYQCMNLTALYNSKKRKQALAGVNKIWLHGRSLPKTCNKIIKHWQKAGMQTSEITLQRIELTLISREGRLAKYLAKSLNKKDKATYLYWKKLYNKPQLLAKQHYWEKRGHYANVMMKIAIERLMHRSLDKAIKILPNIDKNIGFTKEIQQKLKSKIALKAMLKNKKEPTYWLKKINWEYITAAQQEQVLRYFVGKKQWEVVKSLYTTHKSQSGDLLPWQYWYASALEETGNAEKAKELYQELAKKRRYYGFLASDKLGIDYSLNHHSLPKEPSIINQLESNGHLLRAKEFYLLGEDLPARREWYRLVKSLTEQQRFGASHIANKWGWHNRTIITLTMTDQRDDLDLRFPMPYQPQFSTQAKSRSMKTSWPLAIARQESAFLPNATSSAGAKGLMQILPSTAKIQAKREGISYKSRKQLLEPAFNIKLGTAYLNEMLGLFDNNLAVAAAAYNAGPHRVKRWVKKSLAQDQWIESIPYKETRNYVKNVLSYAVIYQHHLEQTEKMPSAVIKPQQMSIIN